MVTVAEAFITMRPSFEKFGSELESQLGRSTAATNAGAKAFTNIDHAAKSAAGSMGLFGSAAVRIRDVAIGVGLYQGIRESFQQIRGLVLGAITDASDLNESLSKTRVVFGDAAAGVEQFAQGSARSLGISRQATLEATATFGNLFTAMRIGQQPAAEMSQTIVKLASDLASFNNTDPAEALLALRAGLVGEIEPLRRFGVNLNQAAIEQRALALGLVQTKEELTPATRAQAAYSIILEQTKTAQGDFARTSDGLANSQRTLSAVFADVSANIGRSLLPVVTTAVSELARLGGDFDTSGTERAMLRIQISIVDMAIQAEGALGKLEKLGEGAGNVLNQINDQVTNAALAINRFLHEGSKDDLFFTIPLAPQNRPALPNQHETEGPSVPDNSFLGKLRASLVAALANAGKDAATDPNKPPIVPPDLPPALNNLKEKVLSLGDAFQGAVGVMRSAASSLFASLTREQAGINLNLDVATLALNNMQYAARPMADALDRATDAISRNRDSLQRQSDSLNDSNFALGEQSYALGQQSYALDQQISALQNRVRQPKTPIEAKIMRLEDRKDAISGQQHGIELAQHGIQLAQHEIEVKNRALDQQQKGIEASRKMMEDSLKQQQRLVDAYAHQASTLESLHKIEKDRLVLADRTLLTEKQQKELAEALIVKTSDFTGMIATVAEKMGVSLVPGLDSAFNAGSALAKTLREEVAPTFVTMAGQVQTWMDRLGGFVTWLAGLPQVAGPPIPTNAMGLTRVPYDNYLTYLHEGERVLTASEAAKYNTTRSVPSQLSALMRMSSGNQAGGGGSWTNNNQRNVHIDNMHVEIRQARDLEPELLRIV